MPAIDFPAAPAVNDEYSFEGRTWRWNGTGWEVKEYPAALLAGTAANPSLYFSGDPNTGLYSPGADQVAISTGGTQRLSINANGLLSTTAVTPAVASFTGPANAYIDFTDGTGIFRTQLTSNTPFIGSASNHGLILTTNNTERLRIDSTGNVGIGTSSPAVTLDVTGQIRSYSTGANPYVSANNGTINNYLAVNATSGTVGTSSNHPLVFLVNDTERLRIDSTGNVGIGTSSPLGTLHLKHATDANIFFRNSTAAGLATGTIIDCFNDATSAATPLFTRASQFAFGTDSAGTFVERLRITTDGNVGIGTSSPGSVLDVRFATSPATDNGNGFNVLRVWTTSALAADAGGAISFGGTATSGPAQAAFGQIAGRKDNSTSADYAGYLQFATNNNTGTMSERMRITSAGNVGIGTSAPSSLLELLTAGDAILTLTGNVASGSNVAAVDFKRNTGTVNASIRSVSSGSNDAGALYLSTRPLSGALTERLRVTPEGNVGIGTTTPAAALDIGTGSFQMSWANNRIINNFDNSFRQGFFFDGSNRQLKIFSTTSDTGGSIGFFTRNSAGASDTDYGSERARIDSSGRLLVGTSSGRGVGGSLQALTQIETTNYVAYSAVNNTNDTGGSALMFGKSRGTAVGSNTIVQNGDNLGDIYFAGADGTDLESIAARITCTVDGTPGANDMPGRLVFSTTADGAASPTERMRIGNNGNTYVGTTAAVYAAGERLSISPNASSNAIGIALENTDNVGIGIYHGYTATGSAIALQFQDHNAVVRGSITVTTSATAYNTSSDYRLKENVAAVTDGITRLQQLKPSRFNFISDPAKTVDGFIAHEVQTVVPEAITGEKDAVDDDGNPVYQGIDQSKLVPLLTAALQEAVAKIESLEARLTAAGL